MVYNWINNIQSRLWPHTCFLCGQENTDQQNLCSACTGELPYKHHACLRCGVSLPTQSQPMCGGCLQQPPFFDRAFVPFNYAAPFNRFIPALKFNHKLEFARLMSELFIQEFPKHQCDSKAPLQCILPVPLHPKRLRQRGFNQSLEISRSIAVQFDLALELNATQRIKNTHAQSDLDKSKRKHNMRNAFEVIRPLPYKHVAIFDDVMTTGHTVNELARVLKLSGVITVEVWAIARA